MSNDKFTFDGMGFMGGFGYVDDNGRVHIEPITSEWFTNPDDRIFNQRVFETKIQPAVKPDNYHKVRDEIAGIVQVVEKLKREEEAAKKAKAEQEAKDKATKAQAREREQGKHPCNIMPKRKRNIAVTDCLEVIYFWADSTTANLLRPYGNLNGVDGIPNKWSLVVDERYDRKDVIAYIKALA